MADICLCYARAKKDIVRRIHALLASDYDVWWDDDIADGDWREQVAQQLSRAKLVVPVWSGEAVTGVVVDEAGLAKKRNIPVLPVRIDDVDPPLGFGSLQTLNFVGWDGDAKADCVQRLLRAVKEIVGPARPHRLSRLDILDLTPRHTALPVFFHSVSSFETRLHPEAAVRALRLTRTPSILVSGYDSVHTDASTTKMRNELDVCRDDGAVVLLDSGGYEAARTNDNTWTRARYHEALRLTPHDCAFSFDNIKSPADVAAAVDDAINSVVIDREHTTAPVFPIVHAPEDDNRDAASALLPEIIARVADALRPPLIAVPERELGDGIVERVRCVADIRRRLDDLGRYQPLHLLGTGNPLSIAIFAAAGADSFDGLEWCRTVVDHQNGRLFHFQQFEFFAWQSQISDSALIREAVADMKIAYAGRVAFHNLEGFRILMNSVREMIDTHKVDRFLTGRFMQGMNAVQLLERTVPEMFE